MQVWFSKAIGGFTLDIADGANALDLAQSIDRFTNSKVEEIRVFRQGEKQGARLYIRPKSPFISVIAEWMELEEAMKYSPIDLAINRNARINE